nr:MAG TPA: hypothetical protein [Caudoviricetes sp.]
MILFLLVKRLGILFYRVENSSKFVRIFTGYFVGFTR